MIAPSCEEPSRPSSSTSLWSALSSCLSIVVMAPLPKSSASCRPSIAPTAMDLSLQQERRTNWTAALCALQQFHHDGTIELSLQQEQRTKWTIAVCALQICQYGSDTVGICCNLQSLRATHLLRARLADTGCCRQGTLQQDSEQNR